MSLWFVTDLVIVVMQQDVMYAEQLVLSLDMMY